MGLLAAIYERLSTDAATIAAVGTYGDLPAVFTSPPLPEVAIATAPAFVVIDPDGSDETICKDRSIRERTVSIDVWAPDTGSQLDVEAAVEAVVEALDDVPVSWPGWNGIVAATDGGERIATDADFIGWTINARFINEREG